MGGDSLAAGYRRQCAKAPVSALHTSSLFYLAAILFVFGLIVNLLAQQISGGIGRWARSVAST